MNTLSFFISSLIIVLMPGVGVIYTISTGITKGKRASVLAAIGCTAGIIPHLCLSIALSSVMLQMGNRIFNIVKIAGAFYLLYLGIRMIVAKPNLSFEDSSGNLKAFAIMRQGILINLLNPKLTVFFFSFLPQYVSTADQSYFTQSFMLGFFFMLLTLIVFIGYGILSGNAKELIKTSPRAINILQKCFGLIFVTFAIQLGFSSI